MARARCQQHAEGAGAPRRAGPAGIRAWLLLFVWVAPQVASAESWSDSDCGMQLRRLCCRSYDIILFLGCAPQQRIPLDLGPGSFEIFVDGERVSGRPSELSLRADKAHVVLVKQPGHVPELVVLRSALQSKQPQLLPAQINVRLRPRQKLGAAMVSIKMERDDAPSEGPLAAGSE